MSKSKLKIKKELKISNYKYFLNLKFDIPLSFLIFNF